MMIALKELNYDNIEYLKNKYNINLDLDLICPIFTYIFYNMEEIVGYSQLQVVGDTIKLLEFVCDMKEYNYRLFYLKSTGLKAYHLGYKTMLNEKHLFEGMDEIIILDELFKGDCHDLGIK